MDGTLSIVPAGLMKPYGVKWRVASSNREIADMARPRVRSNVFRCFSEDCPVAFRADTTRASSSPTVHISVKFR